MTIIEQLARELDRPVEHIENVVRLLDEGNTIPFIARYRKELHGSMDDTALRTLEERLAYLRNLTERKESVKASIAEQEKLTDELAAAIDAAQTLAEVEDLYRPYKPKRRTRATVAKEKGLEPLAALLFAQERDCPRPEEAAADYLSAEKGVETVADALQGANDIVAEWISDDAAIRRGRCASCWKSAARSAPSPRRRRTASTACTTISSSRSAVSRGTRSSPSTAARRRKCSARPSCLTASWRCRCCAARW